MDIAAILKLVGMAVAVLPSLVEAGIDIAQRVANIKKLADVGENATPEMIQQVRDQLDADMAAFNEDLPPEEA